VVASFATGAVLGVLLVAAPRIWGSTALTDPAALGVVFFVRPAMESILVPLIHLAVGSAIGVFRRLVPGINVIVVVLPAVAINSGATLLGSAYGAGVMGVAWWLIGSVISVVLFLLGAELARRVAMRGSSPGSKRTP
jgi:hypothetical protein